MSHECPEDLLDIPGSSNVVSEYINKFKRQFIACQGKQMDVPLKAFVMCDHPELHDILFTNITLHSVTALKHTDDTKLMYGVLTIKTKNKDEINWTKHRMTSDKGIVFGYPFVRQSRTMPEEIYSIRKECITDEQISRMIGVRQTKIPDTVIEEYKKKSIELSKLTVRSEFSVMVQEERIRKDNEFIYALNDIIPVSDTSIHIHATVPALFILSFSFIVL